jgi:hypothetical protein
MPPGLLFMTQKITIDTKANHIGFIADTQKSQDKGTFCKKQSKNRGIWKNTLYFCCGLTFLKQFNINSSL